MMFHESSFVYHNKSSLKNNPLKVKWLIATRAEGSNNPAFYLRATQLLHGSLDVGIFLA